MRVLHVMASGAVGGGLDHLAGLVPALVSVGVDCTVAIGRDGPGTDRLRGLGLAVSTLDLMASRWDPGAPRRLGRAMRAARPEVVHFHGTRAAYYGSLARIWAATPPGVYTVHGLSFRQELGMLDRSLRRGAEAVACRGAHQVISVSAADRVELIDRGYVSAGCCHHIPNAVDTRRFSPGDRAAARAATGLPGAGFIVGTVARLVPQKSLGDLIAAVARCPEVTLAIAGEGPERVALAEQALPLGDRVLFLDTRDDVPELLRAFDLFALSSRWEGEPVALIEAMAAGLPCVATATFGSRELLGEGTGRLVEVGSPPAMAAAIEELRRDETGRATLGAAARAAVAGRSFAECAGRISDVYRSALAG